jgi:signal transduction histidine kinase
MMNKRFFWTAHPIRGLVETWLIGLVLLFLLSQQVGHVSPPVLSNGLLFLCGVCGMWAVLRIRVPQGSWLRQGLWELAAALALSVMMIVGLWGPARLLGWGDVWQQSSLKTDGLTTLFLAATGPGYLLARVGVRFWFLWDRLRRKRMLWALTHAQLTVVVLVILLVFLLPLVFSLFIRPLEPAPPDASLMTIITERLLHTVFPALGMGAVMTAFILTVLLLPSALVSFLVARKTTRRLETLADAAGSLREGDYDTRIEVVGEDEVAQLQADFNAMADDLTQTMHDLEVQRDTVAQLLQDRRELVANVSHELRTPVATMRATLESALSQESESLSPSLQRDLKVAEGEVLRLQRLIDDLFTLSQAEVDRLALDCQLIDVIPVVQRMVDALAPLAWSSSRVEVVAELPEALSQAFVDETRLEQILANLLRNGIRHTPPGGIVAVVARNEIEFVIIEVRDTGEGIAPEDLPYIWERFYRGGSNRAQEGGGVGLGLALVKELTEAMGGSVAVESTVGQGSRFVVKLSTVQS